MEDYRLMQIEDLEDEDEDEDEDEEDDEEHEEDLTPVGITPPRDLGFILDAGEEEYDDDEEDDEEDEEDYEEEGEEGEELIPLARMLSTGSIEHGDYEDEDEDDEDEDSEDDEEEDDEDEDSEEDEVEELIPVEMMSPRVSSSISHGTTLQGPVLINEGLLDDSESREGKPPGNRNNTGGDGVKEELNIEGFFCPICFEAWTSGGEHQICCLPCGHLYGLSCIKKWLNQRRSSGKCPQCNNLCTLKDVTVLYGSPVCIADEEFQKRMRSLEARVSCLERSAQEICKKMSAQNEYLAEQHTYLIQQREYMMEQREFVLRMGGDVPKLNALPPLPPPPPPLVLLPPPLVRFNNATTSNAVCQDESGA